MVTLATSARLQQGDIPSLTAGTFLGAQTVLLGLHSQVWTCPFRELVGSLKGGCGRAALQGLAPQMLVFTSLPSETLSHPCSLLSLGSFCLEVYLV